MGVKTQSSRMHSNLSCYKLKTGMLQVVVCKPLVTKMQKPIVDTPKTKRKKSEHTSIENQLSYLPRAFKWFLKLLFNLIHKIHTIEYPNANKAILITTGQ